jgi:NAD(P)-dependent dehydrogenase (short-subunit alcohol dehydrogenase family)
VNRVLIFGASSGIGEAISRRLSSSFEIFSASRRCPQHVSASKHYSVDLSKANASDHIKEIIFSVQPKHVIYSSGSNIVKQIGSYSSDEIAYLINLNLVSAFHVANSYAMFINKQSVDTKRQLIFLSSIWSVKGAPCRSLYGLTKGGIDSLVRHLSADLSAYNIAVNSIQPGFCRTPLTSKTDSDSVVKEYLSRIVEPNKSLIDTTEIANLVSYLLTVQHSFNAHSFLIEKGLVNAG